MERRSIYPGILTRDHRQLGLPECGPDQAGLAKRLAAAPMRPRKPQSPCDVGLFSDEADQIDLVEMCQNPPEMGDE